MQQSANFAPSAKKNYNATEELRAFMNAITLRGMHLCISNNRSTFKNV